MVGPGPSHSLPVASCALSAPNAGTGGFADLDGGRQVVRGGQRIGDAGDLLAQVDCDHIRTVGPQANRMCAPLATRGAGDEGNPAAKWAFLWPAHQGRSCPLSGSPAGIGCSILISGAPARCSPTALTIPPIAGAALCVFNASSSAHCSTKTKVSPVWCSEYSWQPGSPCTSSTARVKMSRAVSTDSGLTVMVATTTTGI